MSPPVVSAFDRDAAGQAKREALLRVASKLFNRKGIDATSLDEIAAQVGTTKRTLHHHIGSKQDLVAACYERAFRIFFLIKDRMLEHRGSRLDALAAAMHALALAYPSDELTPLSPLVGHGALSPEGQAAFDRNSGLLGDAYHGLHPPGHRGRQHRADRRRRSARVDVAGPGQLARQGRRAARSGATAAHRARSREPRRARAATCGSGCRSG